PPVEENFTNHGSTSHVAVHFGHDLTTNNRFGAIARYGQNGFQVPNERIQEEAGQEQMRSGHETSAQFSYQHIVSANALSDVREQFAYQITDAGRFDPNTPLSFAFNDKRDDREQSLFVQDRIQLAQWAVSAGLRWDHYRLVVGDTAISPRLGLAWALPDHGLV